MIDPVGIIMIIVLGLMYWFSWNKQKQNMTLAVSLLILAGLILRIYVSSDLFLHSWDERYHALVAKNLIKHPFIPTLYDNPVIPFDYKNWAGNHIWLHKQPLPLWSMAVSLKLFGFNEMAVRIPSILLSTIGIVLTFQIGKILFNQKVGYTAAFLYSIHGLIIEVTGGRVATDHIDVFFLFFIELAILCSLYFAKNGKTIFTIFAGISISAAILSKWLPALIVLPVWLFLALHYKQISVRKIILQFVILCITIIVFSLPWQIYIHTVFPLESSWESSFNFKHITTVLDEQGGSWFYHFNKLRIIFGELIYIPLIWFLYKTLKRRTNLMYWSLVIWFLVPLLFFSIVKTKMQAYTLFTAPAIFMITALFWQYLKIYKKRFKYRWMINLILLLIIALPVRYSLERIKPFEKRERNPQWTKEIRNLSETYKGNKNVIFNVDRYIEIMFYSDFIAYEFIPDKQMITELKQKGYKVFLNDNERLPEDLRKTVDVEFIHIVDR